ncbi:MAG: DNA-3-methyladenine glycosylase [Candidatus Omnitrophica bacterium]|nr:DNA-3-methyladenine glycosylase [Candidatus Omnitrophota bacterium]
MGVNSDFKRLNREFFKREPVVVAKELLGKYIIRKIDSEIIIGKIVETEAYGGTEDKGCHVGRYGRTKKTELLFGEVGKAYIYPVYINTYCLNVVAHKDNKAGGVLFRALEPILGIEKIIENLNKDKNYDITKLLNGPGKICKGLKIGRDLNGYDMIEGDEIYIVEGEKVKEDEIITTSRINIPYAGKDKYLPWRFIIKDSKFLSR